MKIALVCAIVSAVSLVACTGSSNSGSQGTPAPEAATPGAAGAMATAASNMMAKVAMHTRTVIMKPLNGSGNSGTATLAGAGAKTTVTISLKGEEVTGKQPAHIHPAHIHLGSCAKLGGVKYPLSDVVLGKSVTVLKVPLDSFNAGNLAINVHESAANLAKYTSCGDIAKANVPM